MSDGAAPPPVRLGLRDELPELARGTLVEIEVVERQGPAAVYAGLLAFATTGEIEKVIAVRCLLEHAHESYRCGRAGEASCRDTDLWAGIARLLQLSAGMLDELRSYARWPSASIRSNKLSERMRVLLRLVSSLRETMLNLLRDQVATGAPVWRVIDSSFDDVVQRCNDLAAATDRLVGEYRSTMASPKFLNINEYLTAQASGSSFRNHNDYLRAITIAKHLGLDMPRLVLGLYQNIEVVAEVRGIKR